ncbi:hypothetical protein SRHO_G00122850 [Serrasalmus rhombeus]
MHHTLEAFWDLLVKYGTFSLASWARLQCSFRRLGSEEALERERKQKIRSEVVPPIILQTLAIRSRGRSSKPGLRSAVIYRPGLLIPTPLMRMRLTETAVKKPCFSGQPRVPHWLWIWTRL